MHWIDKRARKTLLAETLRERGWELYGYSPDESDAMTDYFSPASWFGLAAKDGALVVVRADPRHADEGWPAFRPNPPRATWHVERDGEVLASGTGVYSIEDQFHTGPRPKLARLVERIELAAGPRQRPEGAASGSAGGVAFEVRPGRPGNVEVRFEARPTEQIRSALKAAGFRWLRRDGCWYGPEGALPEELRR